MGIFRKNKDTTPLVPPSSEMTAKILRTYEHVVLDPRQIMLVGSAAAALYDIPLDPIDLMGDATRERPSDLDFAASPLYMEELYARGIAGGYNVETKPTTGSRVGLRIETDELPIDLITYFRDGRDNILRYHKKFLAYLEENSRPIQGSGMRVITLDAMWRELAERQPNDPKARVDLANLRAHIKR